MLDALITDREITALDVYEAYRRGVDGEVPNLYRRPVGRLIEVLNAKLRPGWAIVSAGYGKGYRLETTGD